jgi:hypothetical protein
MNYRTHNNLPANIERKAGVAKRGALMKSMIFTALMVTGMAGSSLAAELPEAPSSSVIRMNAAMIETTVPVAAPKAKESSPVVDKKFLSLAFISTGSTFADSYTTLFARQNWLAGKTGVCNEEVESAYLYGTHPTVARSYAVATVKSAGSIFAAYYLRKHHSKLWAFPLIANSAISLQGVTQNMIECN